MEIASEGQASTQVPHSVHFSGSTTAISSSSIWIAVSGHSSTQVPQPTHSSLLTFAGITNSSKVAKVGKFTVLDIRYITFVRALMKKRIKNVLFVGEEHNSFRPFDQLRSEYLFLSLSSCFFASFHPLTDWR